MSRNDILAGRAYVELRVERSKFNTALTEVRKRLQAFGSTMIGIGAGATAMGGAVLGAFAKTVSLASDFEESYSKFQTVFGENSDAVKAWSDDFAASVGRSKKQIVDFMGETADLFIPLGFDDAAATELSKTLTGLAVDLASFNNKADADVMNDLQAAMTGSGEVMKKYGVVLSETAVQQELLNQAIDPKTATNAQKAQARLNIIMAGTTAAQGDAIRTAGSFSNQLKRLQAIATDAATEIGTALLPEVTKVTTAIGDVLSPVVKWIRDNQTLTKTIAKVALGVTAAGVAIVGIGGAVVGAGAAIGAVLFAVKSFVAGVALMGSVLSAVAATVGLVLSPVGLLVVGLGAAAAAWLAFTESGKKARETIGEGFASALGKVTEAAKAAGRVLSSVWDAIAAGDMKLAGEIAMKTLELTFRAGVEKIAGFIGGTLGDSLNDIAGKILDGDLSGAWETVVASMSDMWAGFVKGYTETMVGMSKLALDTWKKTVDDLTNYILQEASKGGVFGAFFEEFSGVDVKAEFDRKKEIDRQMRERGMNPGEDIIDQIRNGTYQDPTTQAIFDRINENLKNTMDQANADRQAAADALDERVDGAGAAASAEVTRLQQELADLQRRAAMQRAAGANAGPGGAGFGVGDNGKTEGGAGGGVGKLQSVGGFNAAAIAAQAQGMASPQLKAMQKIEKAIEKAEEKHAIDRAMMINALRHPPGVFV